MSNELFTALFPVFFIGIGIYIVFRFIREYLQKQDTISSYDAWTLQKNYQPLSEEEKLDQAGMDKSPDEWVVPPGVTPEVTAAPIYATGTVSEEDRALHDSSYKEGKVFYGFSGKLAGSENEFSAILQEEKRGSGKNSKYYERTIVSVDIPDTQLHMIINSKINHDDVSGGNLERYQGSQKVRLEGDFSNFYDVYMPETTQSETLSMLTPNAMLYILEQLVDYDIEINGPKIYFYAYKFINVVEAEALLGKIPKALAVMRLQHTDARLEYVTNAPVARTARDSSTERRSLRRNWPFFTIFTIVIAASVIYMPGQKSQILIWGVVLGSILWGFVKKGQSAMLAKKYKDTVTRDQSKIEKQ